MMFSKAKTELSVTIEDNFVLTLSKLPSIIEGHPGLKSSKFSPFKLFVLFGIVCICLIWLEVQLLFAIDEYFWRNNCTSRTI